jgi:predicted O-methyltransferase YrrM
MPRHDLFSHQERLPVSIGSVADANPTDIHIFGGHWGEQTYYADYGGIGAKFAPASILEIGVRFGYSGISLCHGALQSVKLLGRKKLLYHGMDGEFFGGFIAGDLLTLRKSNEVAESNFSRFFPDAKLKAEFFHCDTQQEPYPDGVLGRQYDLVNVDGDHSYQGAYNDCSRTWPLLAPGGLMLVDDMSMDGVGPAVREFIREREAAGELLLWQDHHNERDLMLIQKGS